MQECRKQQRSARSFLRDAFQKGSLSYHHQWIRVFYASSLLLHSRGLLEFCIRSPSCRRKGWSHEVVNSYRCFENILVWFSFPSSRKLSSPSCFLHVLFGAWYHRECTSLRRREKEALASVQSRRVLIVHIWACWFTITRLYCGDGTTTRGRLASTLRAKCQQKFVFPNHTFSINPYKAARRAWRTASLEN